MSLLGSGECWRMLAGAACVPVSSLAAMTSTPSSLRGSDAIAVDATQSIRNWRMQVMHAHPCMLDREARAGVPGMVGGMLRHMRSLRTMQRECAGPPDSPLCTLARLLLCACMRGARLPHGSPTLGACVAGSVHVAGVQSSRPCCQVGAAVLVHHCVRKARQ